MTDAITHGKAAVRPRMQFSFATLLLGVIAAGACVGFGLSRRDV